MAITELRLNEVKPVKYWLDAPLGALLQFTQTEVCMRVDYPTPEGEVGGLLILEGPDAFHLRAAANAGSEAIDITEVAEVTVTMLEAFSADPMRRPAAGSVLVGTKDVSHEAYIVASARALDHPQNAVLVPLSGDRVGRSRHLGSISGDLYVGVGRGLAVRRRSAPQP